MSPIIAYFTPIADTLALYLGLSSLLALVVGFVWYSEQAFGPLWRSLSGVMREQIKDQKAMAVRFTTMVFSVVLVSLAVGLIFLLIAPPFSMYLSAFFWVAFSLGTSLANHAFQRRPWMLYAIDQGYNLCVAASAVLMAYILIVPAMLSMGL